MVENLKCLYRISVKTLILDETKTKFLLFKWTDGMRDFPGWWLNFWEDIYECIIREIKEESWLEVTWIASFPTHVMSAEKSNPQHQVVYVVYEAKLKNMDFVPSEECQEMRFFTREEAEKIAIYSNVKEFLELGVI